MGKIIGIDLGTTNSCVAYLDGQKQPRVIESSDAKRTTPSVVAYSSAGIRVGEAAQRQMVTNPTRTIFGAKRLIGRKVNSDDVKSLAKTAPFRIAAAPNGDAWIRIDEAVISPQEIASHILVSCKDLAEKALGETITRAIVTVPAYFDDTQRQATRDAGSIAGLEVLRILNEPTAAALAYGAHRQGKNRRVIAVFDLGGGTFDVSIMAVEDGIFEVLATSGDTTLGGDDWDRVVVERLVDEIFDAHGVDVTQDPVAMGRIFEAVTHAKQELSIASSSEISLPYLALIDGNPLQFTRRLERAEFESLTKPLLQRLSAPCQQAMTDAGLSASDLEEVLLVGGMTRMPAVQATVSEIFQRKPSKGANPDEIVALGAAAYAGIIAGELDDATLLDVAAHTIGIRVGQNAFAPIIDRNSMLPVRERKVFATSHDGQAFVDVEIYQGESKDTRQNRKLGHVRLDELPQGSAGQIKIELVMTLNVESILHVTAKELRSGKKTKVEIKPTSGLSETDINQIIVKRRKDTESDS